MNIKDKTWWVVIEFVDGTKAQHDDCKRVELEGAADSLFVDDGNYHWYPHRQIKKITRSA